MLACRESCSLVEQVEPLGVAGGAGLGAATAGEERCLPGDDFRLRSGEAERMRSKSRIVSVYVS